MCNWRYAFSSTDVFSWKSAPDTDLAMKTRWKYGGC
jgi:hypothetical protein